MPPLNIPLDLHLSPFTGYTRAHWVEAVERLAAGLTPRLDSATGIVRMDGDPRETALAKQLRNPGGELEVFERTQILVAAYIAATGKTTLPGDDRDVTEIYRRGMRTLLSAPDQAFGRVGFGAGSILALLHLPQHFLDPLDAATRADLKATLSRYALRNARDCNTMLFPMMSIPLLDRLDGEYDRARFDDYFDTILSMYRGDGWFIDGWNRGFDHYNFWGFQLYLHALMHFDARWRKQYAERVREITRLHEATVPYWFGKDGAPVPKGRSLTYRFAVLSGLGYARLSGLGAMPPGQARRICSGCLKYFLEHGCLSERGLLEPGYWGPNSAVGEDYTDLGAPYWAATGLAVMYLPPDHPFWAEPEEPIPADSPGIKRLVLNGAQLVLKADGDRGEARAHVVGEPFFHRRVWQAGSKYYQHAYSSALGHALAGDLGPEFAAGRTGLSRDGQCWSYRTWPRVITMDEHRARSAWDAWPGREGETGTVITDTLFLDRGEIHVFWHEDPDPCYLTIGGYAVRLDHHETPRAAAGTDRLTIRSQAMWSVMAVRAMDEAAGPCLMEMVRPRPGFKHAHLFGGWSAFPRWTSTAPVPPGAKIAVFVDAARRDAAPSPSRPPWRRLAALTA